MSGKVLNMTGGSANAYIKRKALARNLQLMGVEAYASESLDDLIAKVLDLDVTNSDSCSFVATLADEPPYDQYGYLSRGETFVLGDEVEITTQFNMSSASLCFTGDGAEEIELSGDTASLWTDTTRETGTLIVTYSTGELITRFELRDALASLEISSPSAADVVLELYCTGTDGANYYAVSLSDASVNGAMSISIGTITWGALEDGYTWGDLEGLTFDEISALPKPESA